MPCTNPILIRFRKDESGKKEIQFVNKDNYDLPFFEKNGKLYTEKAKIPCKQCLGCKIDYANEWGFRCHYELQNSPFNFFVTLTYDEDHLPFSFHFDENTGEVISFPTLKKSAPSAFMKKLRKHYERIYNWQGIRFFACGEYGDQSDRPHYHIILFNMPINSENKTWKTDNHGHVLWTNAEIEKLWGKGRVTIAEANYNSSRYVAKYIMKKQYGQDAKFYKERKIEPEFILMSRNPGIGANHYPEIKKKMENGENPFYRIRSDGHPYQSQKIAYFDRLFEKEGDPHKKMLQEIKEMRRRAAEEAKKNILMHTSLTEEEYNRQKEEIFKARLSDKTQI